MTKNRFKEYYAWLQPDKGFSISHTQIKGADNASFAMEELAHGLKWQNNSIVIGDSSDFVIEFINNDSVKPQGYRIKCLNDKKLTIEASDSAGFLYGAYALLIQLSLGNNPLSINIVSTPCVKRRALNHWDNMSGKIERGYSGDSLFFKNGKFAYDPVRIKDYARLLASIGVNELSINNVNVNSYSIKLVTKELLPELAELADIFRPFGIKLLISIDFEAPVKLGGLPTADPLDEYVLKWWCDTVKLVYSYIPDLAGFVVKADSEFRGGPATLGRTQADGANMMAAALAECGGVVYWRCFVYNCQQDWRDTKTDRPKAAYENFYPLDGTYHKNVILQIKNGPVDFQVREPNSPLFGSMKKTAQAVEFQVSQEYTGQQIDLFALAVTWEDFFKMPIEENRLTADLMGKEVISITAVTNTGLDENWTGHLLAQANLYAFGRLAWSHKLTAEKIIDEWVKLTFGNNPKLSVLKEMMLQSRDVYESYTSPLGLGWMNNIGHHYGPSPEGYEFMKWGTYHRANTTAIGVDRTANGTGYTTQYDPWVDSYYSNLETCPESLLLFFHRVRYDYVLKSGKTLLQHIYDSHFEGVEGVENFIKLWNDLKDCLPHEAYESVSNRLQRQLLNAIEWRDVINTYFFRKTGITDEKGRKIYD